MILASDKVHILKHKSLIDPTRACHRGLLAFYKSWDSGINKKGGGEVDTERNVPGSKGPYA